MTSPIFITKHLNLNKSKSLPNHNNGYLLYPIEPISDRLFCAFVCNSDRTLTEISRFQIPFPHVSMEAFCNGLFCFFSSADNTIYLWNPSIQKSKMLATTAPTFKTRYPLFNHGLAYHSQNNDFKILRIVCYNEWLSGEEKVLPPEAAVYTLSTDSWRRVVIPVGSLTRSIHHIQENPFIFLNGTLHCIAYTLKRCFILCFDVSDERFREIMLPNSFRGFSLSSHIFERLAVFKGSLAVVAFGKGLDEVSNICHICVMREYGVAESWTKKRVPINSVKNFYGCTDNGELLIETQDGRVVSFDPDSLNENRLGIRSPGWLRYTTDFMESLVLVDGVN